MWMTISAPLLSWLAVRAVGSIAADRGPMVGVINGTLLSVALWGAVGFVVCRVHG